MRRQYLLAALTFIALLAAAPSWNDTTCDRTTPLPAGFTESSTASGDAAALLGPALLPLPMGPGASSRYLRAPVAPEAVP